MLKANDMLFNGLEVQCSNCDSEYMHFEEIHTFSRKREDAEEGTKVVATREGVSLETNMEGNPSSRRDGVAIYLSCEYCNQITKLCIDEHKGFVGIDAQVAVGFKLRGERSEWSYAGS